MTPAHRYFFGILPTPGEAKRLGAYRDDLRCGTGDIVADHRLHMTLGITDDHADHDPALAQRLIAIGSAIDAEPFPILFDRVSGSGASVALRPSRKPPLLGGLQRQIGRHMAAAGLGRSGWTFNPHVTLFYIEGQAFLRPCPPFHWMATELVLIHSLVGETRHLVLGRWPLVRKQLDFLAF